MSSCICTLFENDYHYGVASLINSLHQCGYQGQIFAGYKGDLPPWAKFAIINPTLNWPNARTYGIENTLQIHFLPLITDHHLTNYKPDFILEILNGPAKDISSLFYFDPDIVVIVPWKLFPTWISCGVALCEDVNSPLSQFHPRRVAWRKYYGERGYFLKFKNSLYVNGGFIGFQRSQIDFIYKWKHLQIIMGTALGSLNWSTFTKLNLPQLAEGIFAPFSKSDQDALNATIEAWEGEISYLGQDAMGFKPGEILIPHAIGRSKPWNSNSLQRSFAGYPPRKIDYEFWKYANGVVKAYEKHTIILNRFFIILATIISRFYKRKDI